MPLCRLWKLIMTRKDSPAALYIHIPFCVQKCSYCDFYSLEAWDSSCLQSYVDALTGEIRLRCHEWGERCFASIFFGGGTPSLLNTAQIATILDSIYRYYRVHPQAEITIEANPATLGRQKLRGYCYAGVNRISLGVQSFFDDELLLLGRIHSAQDVYKTFDMLRQAGIDNINLDLIYGLPNQSMGRWLANLRKAIELKPEHISAYLLQLEASTPMGQQVQHKELALPDDELLLQMYHQTRNLLQESNYFQYEISNFALTGRTCQHNIFYWKAYDYLGLGVGAVSKLGGIRRLNQAAIEQYIKKVEQHELPPQTLLESMDEHEQLADAIIMGLRMVEGINRQELYHRFGLDPYSRYEKEIDECINRELLLQDGDMLRLTEKGYFLSNEVFYRFLP